MLRILLLPNRFLSCCFTCLCCSYRLLLYCPFFVFSFSIGLSTLFIVSLLSNTLLVFVHLIWYQSFDYSYKVYFFPHFFFILNINSSCCKKHLLHHSTHCPISLSYKIDVFQLPNMENTCVVCFNWTWLVPLCWWHTQHSGEILQWSRHYCQSSLHTMVLSISYYLHHLVEKLFGDSPTGDSFCIIYCRCVEVPDHHLCNLISWSDVEG